MRVAALLAVTLLAGCFDVPALPTGDPPPVDCANCDNGAFCDGPERCVDGVCEPGPAPCGPTQTCDEARDRCVERDPSRPDGDLLPDGGAVDAGQPDAGADDCCAGVQPGVCQRARCVEGECVARPAEDDTPCGPTAVCRAGACLEPCANAFDCPTPPAGQCQRPTCVDGICGVADCPGDVCDGDCAPCRDASDCPAGPACHAAACVDDYCALRVAPGAECDDGRPCFTDDRCDEAGQCVSGNVYACEAGEVCSPGTAECAMPPQCGIDADCNEGERDRCNAGQCVQCRVQADCVEYAEPLCRQGECVCEGDDDCNHLDGRACIWPDGCATEGEVQRGRCEGRRCVARTERADCARQTDGRICENADGICVDAVCLPEMARVTVNCPDPLSQIRVVCDGEVMLETHCGDVERAAFDCPRTAVLTVCCTSDLINDCAVPLPPGSVPSGPVSLRIQPALEDVACVGPEGGSHRQCTGRVRQDPTITCQRP